MKLWSTALKLLCHLVFQKGCGYHLDLFVLAILIAICSVMGLPWFVAATVLSINHVNSLKLESECAAPGEKPQFLGVRYITFLKIQIDIIYFSEKWFSFMILLSRLQIIKFAMFILYPTFYNYTHNILCCYFFKKRSGKTANTICKDAHAIGRGIESFSVLVIKPNLPNNWSALWIFLRMVLFVKKKGIENSVFNSHPILSS